MISLLVRTPDKRGKTNFIRLLPFTTPEAMQNDSADNSIRHGRNFSNKFIVTTIFLMNLLLLANDLDTIKSVRVLFSLRFVLFRCHAISKTVYFKTLVTVSAMFNSDVICNFGVRFEIFGPLHFCNTECLDFQLHLKNWTAAIKLHFLVIPFRYYIYAFIIFFIFHYICI